jgi:hypothetical protein
VSLDVPPDRRPEGTRAHLSAACSSPAAGEHAARADGPSARSSAAYADEIALFDGYCDAVAYVVTDDDLTIYVWEGDPVAYLVDDSGYGFNGEHLA